MTKSDLINTLKKESDITRPEATYIVNLFFDEMSNALANGDRVKSVAYVPFMLKNTKRIQVETQKPDKRLESSLRNCRFLNPARN